MHLGDCLPTPHPLSLSPYEGEREENLVKGFAPLSLEINGVFKRGVSPSSQKIHLLLVKERGTQVEDSSRGEVTQ